METKETLPTSQAVDLKLNLVECMDAMQGFLPLTEMQAIIHGCRGEEGDHFREILREFGHRIYTMPTTYQQDGKGNQAVAYLHYFHGGMNWYITEKDIDTDGEGQRQAFGWASIGGEFELGYIDIHGLVSAGVELDLHFEPKTLEALGMKSLD